MKTSTFSTVCLQAISHLSQSMQNRIIADVTRYQLTGEIPEKMPPMRRALFISLILQLDPDADLSGLAETHPVSDASDDTDKTTVAENPVLSEPSVPSGNTATPLYTMSPMFPVQHKSTVPPIRAERRRLMRANKSA